MVERLLENGEARQTVPPEITLSGTRIEIQAPDAGASIGYRLGKDSWFGSEAWKLYTGPFSIEGPTQISAKAVRYGWDASDVTIRAVSAAELPMRNGHAP